METQATTVLASQTQQSLNASHSNHTSWGVLYCVETGIAYPIEGRTVVGRAPTCDVCLDDDRISAMHCIFSLEFRHDPEKHLDRNCIILEDHSSNGTFVGNKRVGKLMRTRLRSGDVIGLVFVRQKYEREELHRTRQYLFRFLFQNFCVDCPDFERSVSVTRRPRRWQQGPVIGEGGSSKVFLGLDADTGEMIAIKQVAIVHDGLDEGCLTPCLTQLDNEVSVLATLSHPRIVHYLGFEQTNDCVRILLEYVSGGSLQTLIRKFGGFCESIVSLYAFQILQGVEYLHASNVVHGDIKPANILISDKGIVKLTDFGTSRLIAAARPASLSGTPLWMSPELIQTQSPTSASDIWAFGCVVLEMASGYPPWYEKRTTMFEAPQIIYQIGGARCGPSLEFLERRSSSNANCSTAAVSPDLKHLLTLCFAINPTERPSAKDLLLHSFFQSTQAAPLPEREASLKLHQDFLSSGLTSQFQQLSP